MAPLHLPATPPLPLSSPLHHLHLSKATQLPCPQSRWLTATLLLLLLLHLHPACHPPCRSHLKTKFLLTPHHPQIMELSRWTTFMKILLPLRKKRPLGFKLFTDQPSAATACLPLNIYHFITLVVGPSKDLWLQAGRALRSASAGRWWFHHLIGLIFFTMIIQLFDILYKTWVQDTLYRSMGRHPAKNMESQLMTGKVFRNADVIKWSACFASNQFKTNLNRLSGFCNFNFNSSLIALNVLFEPFAKVWWASLFSSSPGICRLWLPRIPSGIFATREWERCNKRDNISVLQLVTWTFCRSYKANIDISFHFRMPNSVL